MIGLDKLDAFEINAALVNNQEQDYAITVNGYKYTGHEDGKSLYDVVLFDDDSDSFMIRVVSVWTANSTLYATVSNAARGAYSTAQRAIENL